MWRIIILLLAPTSLNWVVACGDYEFECSTGTCIHLAKICDGTEDCPEGEDEALNCLPCFKCPGSKVAICLPQESICNGVNDCSDGADEIDCSTNVRGTGDMSCLADDVLCANGKCIPHQFACDGEDDCGDWSDESACDCNEGEVNCGRCIPESWFCDTVPDCPGAADETNCGNPTDFTISYVAFKSLVKQHFLQMDSLQRQKLTDALTGSDKSISVTQLVAKAKLKRNLQRKVRQFLRS